MVLSLSLEEGVQVRPLFDAERRGEATGAQLKSSRRKEWGE